MNLFSPDQCRTRELTGSQHRQQLRFWDGPHRLTVGFVMPLPNQRLFNLRGVVLGMLHHLLRDGLFEVVIYINDIPIAMCLSQLIQIGGGFEQVWLVSLVSWQRGVGLFRIHAKLMIVGIQPGESMLAKGFVFESFLA